MYYFSLVISILNLYINQIFAYNINLNLKLIHDFGAQVYGEKILKHGTAKYTMLPKMRVLHPIPVAVIPPVRCSLHHG